MQRQQNNAKRCDNHDGYNEYRFPDAAQYHCQHQRGDEDHDNNVHLRPHLYLIAITQEIVYHRSLAKLIVEWPRDYSHSTRDMTSQAKGAENSTESSRSMTPP
eukprot:TRINITY_DN8734_c0_g1_i1.p2 TRINITY_DN8734_c0_g1~~TRINITY_DN8734_c0_g1_i1.p2  ORF type:complete len:103 (+),score=0.48 TRINITY_DN8734_c0_g1_i1:210-518(+)